MGISVTVRLGSMTWPEFAAADRPILLVPLGSCEQHGPHLPFDTDTRIASAVTEAVADGLPGAVVAPAIGIGASGEHAGFAGTLSIGCEALAVVLRELVRSADAFAGVIVVNGHGGNSVTLAEAVIEATTEGRRVLGVNCHVHGGDPHAGFAETSMLLHLCPEVVRTDRIEVGVTTPWAELRERAVSEGFAAVSANGVLGDPTRATAEDGRRLFARLVADVQDMVAEATAGWR